jgi:ParB-like chromosome segregation protein Spo0J
MSKTYQVMPPLTPEIYAALKEDIRKRGVLLPIEKDEEGNTLDGHQREKIVRELRAEGVDVADPPCKVREGLTDAEKRSLARALNIHRRQLTPEQRRQIIEDELKGRPGDSNRQIAGALQVDHKTVGTVRQDLEARGEIPHVEATTDTRGRSQPAKRKRAAPSKEASSAPAMTGTEPAPAVEEKAAPRSGEPTLHCQMDGPTNGAAAESGASAAPQLADAAAKSWRSELESAALAIGGIAKTLKQEAKAPASKRDPAKVLNLCDEIRRHVCAVERVLPGRAKAS